MQAVLSAGPGGAEVLPGTIERTDIHVGALAVGYLLERQQLARLQDDGRRSARLDDPLEPQVVNGRMSRRRSGPGSWPPLPRREAILLDREHHEVVQGAGLDLEFPAEQPELVSRQPQLKLQRSPLATSRAQVRPRAAEGRPLRGDVFEQGNEHGAATREAGNVDPFLPAARMVDERPQAVEGGNALGSGEAAVTASSLMHLVGAEPDRGARRSGELVQGAGCPAGDKRGTRDPASHGDIRRSWRILNNLEHPREQHLCGARRRCAKIDMHLGVGRNNLPGDPSAQDAD